MSQAPDLQQRIAKAIAHYWQTRLQQSRRQKASGQRDQGARGAVTGGAQMNGFNKSTRPWLGYLFLLERCDASLRPVEVAEPHFHVFPEFKEASYARRYELFCRKLARERHYDATAFLMAEAKSGTKGAFTEPAEDLTFIRLAKSLGAHVAANWNLAQ